MKAILIVLPLLCLVITFILLFKLKPILKQYKNALQEELYGFNRIDQLKNLTDIIQTNLIMAVFFLFLACFFVALLKINYGWN